MSNGLLATLLSLVCAAEPGQAKLLGPPGTPVVTQTVPIPSHLPEPEQVIPPVMQPGIQPVIQQDLPPWQPPDTEHFNRPNIGPKGYRYYGNVDYILWWTSKDSALFPTVIDEPGFEETVSLPGLTDSRAQLHHGVRASLGRWLDQQQRYALELNGFWISESSTQGLLQDEEFSLYTQYASRVAGVEAQFRGEFYRGDWVHFDFLGGFRYLRVGESFELGLGGEEMDQEFALRLGTRNDFYGGQIGTEMELHYNKCFLNFWTKLALGATCETVRLFAILQDQGQTVVAESAGPFRQQVFAVVPELGVNIGYHLTEHLRVKAGYTLIYLSDAVRPGAQFNALFTGSQNSAFPFSNSEFWIQGLDFGVEFRF